MTTADSFRTIRVWDGSKDRAFEELAFQLREPEPAGSKVTKTGNPDGGLEWYVELPGGDLRGGQAKYYIDSDISSLLSAMRKSLKDALTNRPNLRKVTFAIPVDLPDAIDRSSRARKSQRQKYEEALLRWRTQIPIPDNVEIVLETAGILLERLAQPRHRGLEAFWWSPDLLDLEWCRIRLDMALDASLGGYAPNLQVGVEADAVLEGLMSGLAWDMADWSELWQLAGRARELIEQDKDLPASVAAGLSDLGGLPDDVADAMSARTSVVTALARTHELLAEGAGHEAPWLPRTWAITEAALALLTSPRAVAAEKRALFLFGEGGAGKTHTLFVAAERALANGIPVVPLLGVRFRGGDLWRDIENQLGLSPTSMEELLGALEASAVAHGGRLLCVIDALNETDEPGTWASELPALIRAVRDYPHIALAVSVKDLYLPLVDPNATRERDWCALRHNGFATNVEEAVRLYFGHHGIAVPSGYSPPHAFSNPLFLKLYCLGLQDAGITEPPTGGEYETTVFERYLDGREELICRRLRLDPSDHPVRSAVDSLAAEMARAGQPWIPRAQARAIVDSHAAHLHDWPETLFGSLHQENVIVGEVVYGLESGSSEPDQRIRFSYNRFSDYVVADAMLRAATPNGTLEPARLESAMRRSEPGLVSAIATLAAERTGLELAALSTADEKLQRLLVPAVLDSLRYRRPGAIGTATEQLVESALLGGSFTESALDLVLGLAATDSPFNADWIHAFLLRLPMAERDRIWSVNTVGFDEEWPRGLSTVIGEARTVTRDPSSIDQARLDRISTALAWTLSSPDGLLRSFSIRLLAHMWTDRLGIVPGLLDRFLNVDDANVLAGVLVAAHGAVLRGGSRSPDLARRVGDAVIGLARTRPLIDDVARDAVDGVNEWIRRSGGAMIDFDPKQYMIDWSSEPPADPGSRSDLENEFPQKEYGSLYSSLFGFGDFGNYIVEPRVRHFSRFPLDGKRPTDPYGEAFDSDFASRWILRRVVELGWTPERFEEIDRWMPSSDSGRAHRRVERFGKKYQWIALRELLARLRDNFHPTHFGEDPRPAAYFGRDLDPSFGPIESGAPVDQDESAWWLPQVPTFVGRSDARWASRTDNLVSMDTLVRPIDDTGRGWVALARYGSWSAPHDAGNPYRHEWQILWSWLVALEELASVVELLSDRTLWGRWMPEEPQHTDGPYLGELPWASSARRDDAWLRPWRAKDWPDSLKVAPAVESYTWESTIRDPTLAESQHADVPARTLFDAGRLVWTGGRSEWSRDGDVVAVSRSAGIPWHDHRTALLVHEEWLIQTLSERRLGLVFGYLGGREILGGPTRVRARPQSSIDGRASLASDWRFDAPVIRLHQRGVGP